MKELKEIKKIDYLISTEDNEIYADPFIYGNILETYEILKKYSKELLLSFLDLDYIRSNYLNIPIKITIDNETNKIHILIEHWKHWKKRLYFCVNVVFNS